MAAARPLEQGAQARIAAVVNEARDARDRHVGKLGQRLLEQHDIAGRAARAKSGRR